MRIPGVKTLRQAGWRIRGRVLGGAVILGYHRVADDAGDPWSLCVRPTDFDAHMRVLRREFEPVRLAELDQASGGRRRLRVAVTFDDGYADVATEAVPILERHDLPATVFAVPGAVAGAFWWDRLRGILADSSELPADLDLEVAGERLRWSADEGLAALHTLLHRSLHVLDQRSREDRLDALSTWAGARGDDAGLPAVLSEEQLARLGRHPLIEVGSHTATHADLSGSSGEALEREIVGSRERLTALTGRPVESFSYPHGGVGAEVRERVARAGYLRACSSSSGLVSRGTDPYLLPRLWPPPADEASFRRWIRSWTGH